jgi:hypothetical protein
LTIDLPSGWTVEIASTSNGSPPDRQGGMSPAMGANWIRLQWQGARWATPIDTGWQRSDMSAMKIAQWWELVKTPRDILDAWDLTVAAPDSRLRWSIRYQIEHVESHPEVLDWTAPATRPTIYLTNASSKRQHGPGRRWCAMAAPGQHHHGDGRVIKAAPLEADLRSVLGGEITSDEYRALCVERFEVFAESGSYAPGKLRGVMSAAKSPDGRPTAQLVMDGDTLFCACPRPDRPRRFPFCHIEVLAPFLVAAGWAVVLYGVPFNPEPKENP